VAVPAVDDASTSEAEERGTRQANFGRA